MKPIALELNSSARSQPQSEIWKHINVTLRDKIRFQIYPRINNKFVNQLYEEIFYYWFNDNLRESDYIYIK